MAVSFIGGGNRSTRRKPLTCRKSLTHVITGKRFHNYCTQQTAYRICMQTWIWKKKTSSKSNQHNGCHCVDWI